MFINNSHNLMRTEFRVQQMRSKQLPISLRNWFEISNTVFSPQANDWNVIATRFCRAFQAVIILFRNMNIILEPFWLHLQKHSWPWSLKISNPILMNTWLGIVWGLSRFVWNLLRSKWGSEKSHVTVSLSCGGERKEVGEDVRWGSTNGATFYS